MERVEYKGWFIEFDEISAGVYRIVARGPNGEIYDREGVDPDSLLRDCKQHIQNYERDRAFER
jgi:hypothetical protein